MEKKTEIKHKRERERHREEKTDKYQAHLVEGIKHTWSKQQGSLPGAAKPS